VPPRPAVGARRAGRARAPLADGQFDVVTISAVLHHVLLTGRLAVYAELGRVLLPGGWLYVFEHNTRNPPVRHVISRTPIDENAILLDAREVQEDLVGSGRSELETDYLMFMPPATARLRFVDQALAWLPLGAQYIVAACKPAEEARWTSKHSRPSSSATATLS
jgi:SAM-dependent methyltransferase